MRCEYEGAKGKDSDDLTSNDVPITSNRSAFIMSSDAAKNLSGRGSPKNTMSGLITPLQLSFRQRGTVEAKISS